MPHSKVEIEMRAPVDDDLYVAAICVRTTSNDGAADWAELYLENVNESAIGHARVADARVVVRTWLDNTYLEFPYDEAISALERARQRLLDGESRVQPVPD